MNVWKYTANAEDIVGVDEVGQYYTRQSIYCILKMIAQLVIKAIYVYEYLCYASQMNDEENDTFS